MRSLSTMARNIGRGVLPFLWLGVVNTAHAASVSYFLDQSNENMLLPDGTNYLRVTISDGMDGDIDFSVEILNPLTSNAGSNFGLQSFSFNSTADLDAENVTNLPDGWQARGSGQHSGFGLFDMQLKGNGSSRVSPLFSFSISDIDGDSPADYALFSTRGAGEGHQYFAAHVAGFTGYQEVTSAHFGGYNPVPVPAALWLFGSGVLGLALVGRRKKA